MKRRAGAAGSFGLLAMILGTDPGQGAEWRQAHVAPPPQSYHAMVFDEVRSKAVLAGSGETWEHDGTRWRPVTTVAPPARARHAMAYDAARGRCVLFGGLSGSALRDTWEFDGHAWRAGATAPAALTARHGHAMAYDAARGVVVLHGGFDGTYRRDTWEYDGTGWSAGAVGAMGPRRSHAMAFDAARGRIVIFGGESASTYLDDTWELDAAGWVAGAPPAPALTGRWGHAMAYDAIRSRIVLYGGADDLLPALNETWEYDGNAWIQGPSLPYLQARRGHSLAFDVARGVVVMFGGDYGGCCPRGDTWEYSGAGWVQGAGSAPEPRHSFGMAHHEGRDEVVLFGGGETAPNDAETWRFDGTTWDRLPAPPQISARWAPAMAFDAVNDAVLLVGGYDSGGFRNDAWSFDGVSWSAVASVPPALTPRAYHAMAGMSSAGIVVLFGGSDASGYLGDGWQWDGSAFSPTPAAPPGLTPRARHVMTFDAVRGRAVLFGGNDALGALADTWEYDGTSWSAGPAPSLPPRAAPGLAFSPTLGRSVLFGGDSGGADTWEYDGVSWMPGAGAPPGLTPRYAHGMAFHGATSSVVLFGGFAGNATGELWLYGTCAALDVQPAALPGGSLGVPYAVTLTLPGANPPVDFVLSAGGLPPGLVLDPSGLLSGTPLQAGDFSFAVTATDAAGCSASRSYGLAIGQCPAIDLSPAALPDATVGVPFAQTIVATGGTPPYGYAISGGSLPPGFSFAPDGTLSGTPLVEGSFAFDVTAVDSRGCSGMRSYVLRVCAAISISPALLPPATAGTPYAVVLGATGGAPPHTFTVAAGGLPPGVTLAAAGALSGTPAQAGAFSFTVRAADATGCAGLMAYDLSVYEILDLVTGAGTGAPNPNEVRVRNASGAGPVVDFFAYAAGAWGVNVGSGDVDGPVAEEMLTGPGPGEVFGPQARAFDRDGTPLAKVNFYAYGTLKYGLLVVGGALDADGYHEILTGAGPGAVFGPHVRAFDVDGGPLSPIAKVSFFAYGTLRWGVNVASGDVEGDGYGEVITGAGPGIVFAPVVRGFDVDGGAVTSIQKINFQAFPVAEMGAVVGSGDAEGDGIAEIAVALGPGSTSSFPSQILGFDYDGVAIAAMPGLDATVAAGTLYGARVALGDLSPDGAADLVGGVGPDPAAPSTVRSWSYDGTALTDALAPFDAFETMAYGAGVATGRLGH